MLPGFPAEPGLYWLRVLESLVYRRDSQWQLPPFREKEPQEEHWAEHHGERKQQISPHGENKAMDFAETLQSVRLRPTLAGRIERAVPFHEGRRPTRTAAHSAAQQERQAALPKAGRSPFPSGAFLPQ